MLAEAEDAHVVLCFADTNEAGTNAAATEHASNIAPMVMKQDVNITLLLVLFTTTYMRMQQSWMLFACRASAVLTHTHG